MGKTLEECYDILGLDFNATEAEIKSAYRQKALRCHPDKNPDDPSSTQKFQELGHAYRRLMGEEDSDEEDEYDNDDDMDLWRDLFFFLFRDEIMAKVRCRCRKCGNGGDEDDDFLASLAKEQEERYQFTEGEMAQFTSFASLKEQREANKQKFCNKNISSCKPEQKSNKGHKPKLKSNKQLKREQWKKEKEMSEIAAQINRNPKLQEKKASKKSDLHPDKSSNQPVTMETGCPKEQTDHAAYNKRNTRKKRNRKKSGKQESKESDSNQNSSHSSRTTFQQKVASSLEAQDGIKKVPIKPETTNRQDDTTLPHHANYAQQRVNQSSNCGNLVQLSERGSLQSPRPVTTSSRPPYRSNIWQERQERQQFLAELQPANQTDEELQLQIALELSRRQAEIDAQQREINILEKQMEETLQIGKSVQVETAGNDSFCKRDFTTETTNRATVMDPEDFPPAGNSLGSEQECDVVEPLEMERRCDAEEEWVVASGSEEEWGDNDKEDNEAEEFVPMSDEDEWGNSNRSHDEDEEAKKNYLTTYSVPDEKHRHKFPVSSSDVCGRDDVTLHNSDMQLSWYSGGEGPQACPYGKNCCLGKRCKLSHPVSVDKRKRQKSVDECDSQDTHEIRNGHNFQQKYNISPGVTHEELPVSDYLDVSYPVISNGHSLSTFKSDLGDSVPNDPVEVIKPEASSMQLSKCTTQSFPNTARLENINRALMINMPDVESYGDGPFTTQEKPKMNSAINVDGYSGVEKVGNGASVEEKVAAVPGVDVGNSQSPATLSSTGALKQPATTMPHVGKLSVDPKVQNSVYRTTHPVNYVKPLPSSLSVGLSAPVCHGTGQTEMISGTTQEPSQNTAVPSAGGNIPQNSRTNHQSASLESRPLTQPMTLNSFPPMQGFPLFPFGNLPFLNIANVASFNQSLLAMASLSRMPLPIIPGPSTGVLNPQGSGNMIYPRIPSSHSTTTGNGSGSSTQRSCLPTAPLNGHSGAPRVDNASGMGLGPLQLSQAGLVTSFQTLPQRNGLSGIPFAATMQRAGHPLQPSQPGPSNSSQSAVQALPLIGGPVGMSLGTHLSGTAIQSSQSVTGTNSLSSDSMPPLQVNAFTGIPNVFGAGLSQAGLTAIPQTSALDMSQVLRLPLPLFSPQALINMNTQTVSLGVPFANPLNDNQMQSELDASQFQAYGEGTMMNSVKHPETEAQKPAERTLEEGRESSGIRPKAPSLRRPSTVPKVIQHQALK